MERDGTSLRHSKCRAGGTFRSRWHIGCPIMPLMLLGLRWRRSSRLRRVLLTRPLGWAGDFFSPAIHAFACLGVRRLRVAPMLALVCKYKTTHFGKTMVYVSYFADFVVTLLIVFFVLTHLIWWWLFRWYISCQHWIIRSPENTTQNNEKMKSRRETIFRALAILAPLISESNQNVRFNCFDADLPYGGISFANSKSKFAYVVT